MVGHVARMNDDRIPKRLLFGWLPQARPRGGPRKGGDITKIDINDKNLDNWYEVATSSRTEWCSTCHASAERKRITPNKEEIKNNCSVKCQTCRRQFRGECDKARHKCIEERQKPVNEQTGAVRCEHCHRLFRSKGGLLVHR